MLEEKDKTWNVPGGGSKQHEKIEDCIKREVKEETRGVLVPYENRGGLGFDVGKKTRVGFMHLRTKDKALRQQEQANYQNNFYHRTRNGAWRETINMHWVHVKCRGNDYMIDTQNHKLSQGMRRMLKGNKRTFNEFMRMAGRSP